MLFGCCVLGGLLLGRHVRIDPWSKALARFEVIRASAIADGSKQITFSDGFAGEPSRVETGGIGLRVLMQLD
jgi:hypothetical protein